MDDKLTASQKEALEVLLSGQNTFLTGEAGTGKSFLLSHFVTKVKDFKNVLLSAPTGIASLNIGGVTLHRLFGLGTDILSLSEEPEEANISEAIKSADILIIDEISMCRLDVFEKVMRTLKIANSKAQVVLVGDFLQLPPVLVDSEVEVYETLHGSSLYAFESPLWKEFNFVTKQLSEVVRQKDPVFIENLNKARRGNRSCIEYFNNLKNRRNKKEAVIEICARNKTAFNINEKALNKIKSEPFVYSSEIETLESGFRLTKNEKPMDDTITLKVGARVLLCVNLSDKCLFNGQLGTVQDLDANGALVSFDNGEVEYIERYTWLIKGYDVVRNKATGKKKVSLVTIASFKQIPLKPAFAITIHKSQGQTYQKAIVHPSCWERGQLYVALSRASSASGLYLATKIQDSYLVADQKVLAFYNGTYERPGLPKQEEEIEVPVEPEKTVEEPKQAQKTGRKRKFSGLDTKTVRLPVAYIDFAVKVCDVLASIEADEKILEKILKSIN